MRSCGLTVHPFIFDIYSHINNRPSVHGYSTGARGGGRVWLEAPNQQESIAVVTKPSITAHYLHLLHAEHKRPIVPYNTNMSLCIDMLPVTVLEGLLTTHTSSPLSILSWGSLPEENHKFQTHKHR